MAKAILYFLPGWGADERCWAELVNELGTDFDCRYLDLPCELAEPELMLEAWLQRTVSNIEPCEALIGWSLGGMLAVKLVERLSEQGDDRVKRVIMLAANASFVAKPDWPLAMSEAVFSAFYQGLQSNPAKTAKRFSALQAQGGSEIRKVSANLSSISCINSDQQERALAQLTLLASLDIRTALSAIKRPVLALFAEGDALVPMALQSLFKRHWPGIRSRCLLNTGHALQLIQAEQVAEEVKDFLASSDSAQVRSKKRVEKSFANASLTYDNYAHFQRDVATRMLKWAPELSTPLLDLGCGTAYVLEQVQASHDLKGSVGLDLALPMLQHAKEKPAFTDLDGPYWVQGDIESLSFADKSFASLSSSLAVQWCDDIKHCMSEAWRVLNDGGLFLLSTLGPDTLKELRLAWQSADPEHVHVNQFLDADTVINAATEVGFGLELFAQEWKVLRYQDLGQLMAELKGIGAHNVNQAGSSALTGKCRIKALYQAYEEQRESEGLPATYEVYFLLFKK
ncbi:malonyl-ACP O-methyltransferase BioC [Agaribacterium sp. ZY112]|uniref:malonyl-ACP O-methyltransferase BioC n=1 Tax=Agaribacterium sp. ZY112 TaxID=3233574 RepID=UPI00352548EB